MTTRTETTAEVGLFYRGMRGLVRAALGVFYRTIEVTGTENLDPTVPTILACNHPNSIIDPLLLSTFEDRQVCFCARDGLFKIPGFGALLRGVGAVPLKRRSDHGGGAVDNASSFSACREVLLRGGVIAIFPEGKTHSRLRVEPLKTGTVRIALDAAAADPNLGLRIVPVGITYLVRHAFLSDVHVDIGAPIDVAAAAAELGGEDEAARVKAMTARMEKALRELAVHVEQVEDERLITQVTSLVAGIRLDEGLDRGGQSPAERTALARRVVHAYRWAMERDPPRIVAIRERIDRYMDERVKLGLGGERAVLQHRGERRRPLSGAKWIAFFFLGAPVALFGLAASLVPYVLLRTVLRLVRLSTYRVALFKLLGGLVAFSSCWIAMAFAIGWFVHPGVAVLFALSVLPAAMFAHRFVTETRLHRIQLRSLESFAQTVRMRHLRAEREAITKELSDLRQEYLAHMGEEAA